jgi:phenylpyruvate tautomerase PptA (4-oxalocrotonate tautomerase family)
MPLVRIDLLHDTSAEYRRTIGDVIYESMLYSLNVPKDDRFLVTYEHPPEDLSVDPTYLGIRRSSACILIQVTLNEGRSVEQKRAFYRSIVDGLQRRLNVRREDVVINLVEVKRENWSFGNGEAQYA